jgi:chromate transport protein ChrA
LALSYVLPAGAIHRRQHFSLKAAVLAIVIEAVVRIGKRLQEPGLYQPGGRASSAFSRRAVPYHRFWSTLIGFVAQTRGGTAFQGAVADRKKSGEAVVDSRLGSRRTMR